MEFPSPTVKLPDCQMNWDFLKVFFPAGTVSSLPGSPHDNQEIFLLADSASGAVWNLRFLKSTGKWHFIGGAPVYKVVETSETTASGAVTDLATVGPTYTPLVPGDYLVRFGATVGNNTASQASVAQLIYNAATATDDRALSQTVSINELASVGRTSKAVAVAIANPIKLGYFVTGGTGTFLRRWMEITPIRLG